MEKGRKIGFGRNCGFAVLCLMCCVLGERLWANAVREPLPPFKEKFDMRVVSSKDPKIIYRLKPTDQVKSPPIERVKTPEQYLHMIRLFNSVNTPGTDAHSRALEKFILETLHVFTTKNPSGREMVELARFIRAETLPEYTLRILPSRDTPGKFIDLLKEMKAEPQLRFAAADEIIKDHKISSFLASKVKPTVEQVIELNRLMTARSEIMELKTLALPLVHTPKDFLVLSEYVDASGGIGGDDRLARSKFVAEHLDKFFGQTTKPSIPQVLELHAFPEAKGLWSEIHTGVFEQKAKALFLVKTPEDFRQLLEYKRGKEVDRTGYDIAMKDFVQKHAWEKLFGLVTQPTASELEKIVADHSLDTSTAKLLADLAVIRVKTPQAFEDLVGFLQKTSGDYDTWLRLHANERFFGLKPPATLDQAIELCRKYARTTDTFNHLRELALGLVNTPQDFFKLTHTKVVPLYHLNEKELVETLIPFVNQWAGKKFFGNGLKPTIPEVLELARQLIGADPVKVQEAQYVLKNLALSNGLVKSPQDFIELAPNLVENENVAFHQKARGKYLQEQAPQYFFASEVKPTASEIEKLLTKTPLEPAVSIGLLDLAVKNSRTPAAFMELASLVTRTTDQIGPWLAAHMKEHFFGALTPPTLDEAMELIHKYALSPENAHAARLLAMPLVTKPGDFLRIVSVEAGPTKTVQFLDAVQTFIDQHTSEIFFGRGEKPTIPEVLELENKLHGVTVKLSEIKFALKARAMDSGLVNSPQDFFQLSTYDGTAETLSFHIEVTSAFVQKQAPDFLFSLRNKPTLDELNNFISEHKLTSATSISLVSLAAKDIRTTREFIEFCKSISAWRNTLNSESWIEANAQSFFYGLVPAPTLEEAIEMIGVAVKSKPAHISLREGALHLVKSPKDFIKLSAYTFGIDKSLPDYHPEISHFIVKNAKKHFFDNLEGPTLAELRDLGYFLSSYERSIELRKMGLSLVHSAEDFIKLVEPSVGSGNPTDAYKAALKLFIGENLNRFMNGNPKPEHWEFLKQYGPEDEFRKKYFEYESASLVKRPFSTAAEFVKAFSALDLHKFDLAGQASPLHNRFFELKPTAADVNELLNLCEKQAILRGSVFNQALRFLSAEERQKIKFAPASELLPGTWYSLSNLGSKEQGTFAHPIEGAVFKIQTDKGPETVVPIFSFDPKGGGQYVASVRESELSLLRGVPARLNIFTTNINMMVPVTQAPPTNNLSQLLATTDVLSPPTPGDKDWEQNMRRAVFGAWDKLQAPVEYSGNLNFKTLGEQRLILRQKLTLLGKPVEVPIVVIGTRTEGKRKLIQFLNAAEFADMRNRKNRVLVYEASQSGLFFDGSAVRYEERIKAEQEHASGVFEVLQAKGQVLLRHPLEKLKMSLAAYGEALYATLVATHQAQNQAANPSLLLHHLCVSALAKTVE